MGLAALPAAAVATSVTVPHAAAADADKALLDAAVAAGESGYGAHWAGTGCARAILRPAADTVAALAP